MFLTTLTFQLQLPEQYTDANVCFSMRNAVDDVVKGAPEKYLKLLHGLHYLRYTVTHICDHASKWVMEFLFKLQ